VTKVCSGCDREKSLNNFSFSLDGRYNLEDLCLYCSNKRRSANRTTEEVRVWEAGIKSKYNLTPFEYKKILDNQGGVCAICQKKNKNGRRLSVDHNHKTGQVRQLLCHNHNVAIGHFNESIEDMKRAIDYLERHNGK
jgi:DNA-binding helix-hairpin-helix protein with protein kinase domain